MASDFKCLNCKKVIINEALGTANRNHCPFCLVSRHVDLDVAGDRKAICKQVMQPIGLTFKDAGVDKWGKPKQGELMLIHLCQGCSKISINRIAGDDNPDKILEISKSSENLDQILKDELEESEIILLTKKDLNEVKTQLFGNQVV